MGHHHHQRHKAQAQEYNITHGPPDPVRTAGAVVEADDRLGPQGDAPQRHGDHQQIALHHRGTGHQGVPQAGTAVALEHRVQHDQQDTVRGDGEEGGQSEGQHPPYDPEIQSPPAQRHRHAPAPQGQQDKGAGADLGDHRGNGRPGHIHVEQEHEHGVQDNIHHRPQHHRDHPKAGEPLADEEAVHTGGHQGEKGAGSVDRHIGVGIGKGVRTGAKPHEQMVLQQQEQRRQDQRQRRQGHKAVVEDLFGVLQAPLSHAHGHKGRPSQPHQGGKRGQQRDNGAADPHPCQGHTANLRQVSNVHPVHNAVQYADQLGQHSGDRQPQHQPKDRAAAQVFFFFHTIIPSHIRIQRIIA